MRAPGVWRVREPGVVSEGWAKISQGSGCPGVALLGGKLGGLEKLGGFRGGHGVDGWGEARSTCQTTDPWTKTIKSHKNQQNAKKMVGYFL